MNDGQIGRLFAALQQRSGGRFIGASANPDFLGSTLEYPESTTEHYRAKTPYYGTTGTMGHYGPLYSHSAKKSGFADDYITVPAVRHRRTGGVGTQCLLLAFLLFATTQSGRTSRICLHRARGREIWLSGESGSPQREVHGGKRMKLTLTKVGAIDAYGLNDHATSGNVAKLRIRPARGGSQGGEIYFERLRGDWVNFANCKRCYRIFGGDLGGDEENLCVAELIRWSNWNKDSPGVVGLILAIVVAAVNERDLFLNSVLASPRERIYFSFAGQPGGGWVGLILATGAVTASEERETEVFLDFLFMHPREHASRQQEEDEAAQERARRERWAKSKVKSRGLGNKIIWDIPTHDDRAVVKLEPGMEQLTRNKESPGFFGLILAIALRSTNTKRGERYSWIFAHIRFFHARFLSCSFAGSLAQNEPLHGDHRTVTGMNTENENFGDGRRTARRLLCLILGRCASERAKERRYFWTFDSDFESSAPQFAEDFLSSWGDE
ncbi:hypothetical protein DFH06DRAFT_1309719 [Mycena polygramma]|nr:hypothetical protein DFH06DRAFT_1309719 [Mycena polygramma]